MNRHKPDSRTAPNTIGAAICQRLTPQAFRAVISPSADSRPNCSNTVVSTLTGITNDSVKGTLRVKIFRINSPEIPRDM